MSTTTARLGALAAALLCCTLLVSSASAFTVSVGAGAIECFMDDVKTGEKVLGGFNVLSGGQLDIDVKVLDPQNKAVYAENKEMSGTFTFVASQTGLYFICFSNQMSSYTTKIVNFHMHVGSTLGAHQVAKKDHLTGLETSVLTLSEGMTFLKDEMDYLKTRERMHRDSASFCTADSFCLLFFCITHLALDFLSLDLLAARKTMAVDGGFACFIRYLVSMLFPLSLTWLLHFLSCCRRSGIFFSPACSQREHQLARHVVVSVGEHCTWPR